MIMYWISVKNELPEYNQSVLFVNGKNEVSVGKRIPYETKTDDWATENSIYFYDDVLLEISVCKFWMPLPENPKE